LENNAFTENQHQKVQDGSYQLRRQLVEAQHVIRAMEREDSRSLNECVRQIRDYISDNTGLAGYAIYQYSTVGLNQDWIDCTFQEYIELDGDDRVDLRKSMKPIVSTA